MTQQNTQRNPQNSEALPESVAPIANVVPHKTFGEKRFDQLNWILGYVVTFVATIFPAYYFRDSSKTSWFDKDKSWRQWTKDKKTDLANSWFKSFKKNEVFDHEAVSSIFVNTTATFAGGFLVLPVIKWMENNKQKIVRYFNEKKGDEAEVAMGDANTADHESPSWGSLLKGRLASFAIVFTSFMVLIGIAPTQMDKIEKFGERAFVAGGRKLTGKDLGDPEAPLKDLSQPSNWAYRLNRAGNLTVFDSIATGASITLTLAISKVLGKKEKKKEPEVVAPVAVETREAAPVETAPASEKKYTETMQPKPKAEARGEYRDEREREKSEAASAALSYN